MLVRDRDMAPELSDVRRFTHGWEKKASVGLRIGDPDAVESYEEHGRVTGGDRESMLDLLYEAWRDDTDAGKRSLMIANDNDTVTELNQRAGPTASLPARSRRTVSRPPTALSLAWEMLSSPGRTTVSW